MSSIAHLIHSFELVRSAMFAFFRHTPQRAENRLF